MPTEEDCPDTEWRATPSLIKGTLVTPVCPTLSPGSGGSGGSSGGVDFGCYMVEGDTGWGPDVPGLAGTGLTTEPGAGSDGCLRFAVDLVPDHTEDEDYGPHLTGVSIDGTSLRFDTSTDTYTNVYNAAGMLIDRFLADTVVSDIGISRCSISSGCNIHPYGYDVTACAAGTTVVVTGGVHSPDEHRTTVVLTGGGDFSFADEV